MVAHGKQLVKYIKEQGLITSSANIADCVDMIVSKKDTMLLVDDIWERIRLDVSGVYDPKKPNEYQTYDYDTIFRTVTSKVIEGFGAEHDRIHRGRVLIFNPKLLVKSAKQYDVSGATNAKLKEIIEWQKEGVSVEHPQKVTDTPSRGQNDENIATNDNHDKSTVERTDEKKDNAGRDGVTVDLQGPSTVTGTTITSPYSCPYCDNRFETHDLYVRHVVKNHKGWTAYPGPPDLEKYRQRKNGKSNVAEMAEANQSGNGIMDSDDALSML